MPLRANNTKTMHRKTFAGWLQTITLLKRGNDQQEGHKVKFKLFGCWRESITKRGEPIQREMTADHRTLWHIPYVELARNGIQYINVNDIFINTERNITRWWNPESDQTISTDLFGNMIDVECLRIDPAS